MRPHISMIISLIFISNVLATQTYGSTLEKKINVARGSIFNEPLCSTQGQAHCYGKGRKLLMKSHIVSSKDKINKEEANPTKRDNTNTDVLDIAGMDYSPAKRKTPIHN